MARKLARRELDDPFPVPVAGGGELPLDPPHDGDGGRRAVLDQMVDDPVGPPGHGLEHLEPAWVVRVQDIEQRGQQGQRLGVEVALLGLPDRTDQGVHRFRIAGVGRAEKVRRGRTEVARRDERAADKPVKGAAAGAADALVDGILNQRMGDLVAQPAARRAPRPAATG